MLISFEGLDGCGKSTQIDLTSKILESSGKMVKVLREPGGNRICEKIREVLLDRKNSSMSDETEMLLYIASRAQLVREDIASLLDRGFLVILDRYMDSTTAYQGYGRGVDLETISVLNRLATCGGKYVPDLTFFLDIETERSLSRVTSRGEEINRMESESIEFFDRIRKGFLEISRKDQERVKVINASGSVEEVFGRISEVLKQRELL
ncbi:MAG: dTMP kinase [Candidatus Delongbacteria bacterium]|jgi:dTMP kinase|nr:dTMP kinase [Candidatus Delongbacteria bacterium]MDD4204918.1 dTMP kinase [Candidatus Delongbacteria bacterium]MDY0017316.1 dTMP kinase [Candidatus Delongbacteria bacterium]